MIDWIREHPYLSGGLVLALLVLFLIIRRRGSSSAQQVAVAGGPSEALQAASLQAQVQHQTIQAAADVQSQQTAAALAAHLADVSARNAETSAARDVGLQNILTAGSTAQYEAAAALQGDQAKYAAAVDIATTQAEAATAIAGYQIPLAQIQGETAVKLAGIQAPVQLAGIQAALQATESTNQAAVDVATVQANRDVTINAAQVGGAVDVATLQAETQQQQIASTEFLTGKYLDISGALQENQLEATTGIQQNLLDWFRSGGLNKGGEGGANQVQAVTSIFGKTTAPGVVNPGDTLAGVLSGFGNLFTGLGNGLVGGSKLAAAVP